MLEEMETTSGSKGFYFEHIPVRSRHEIDVVLDRLARCSIYLGMKPLIHLDAHGSRTEGLYIEGEGCFYDWNSLAGRLRAINIATGNNLAVVGATCFGLNAIRDISLSTETPFYLMLAPEDEVSTGFLEGSIPSFYRSVFEQSSIDAAFDKHLSGAFKYFHCDKMLFIAIAHYVIKQCKGRGGAARRERLLTEVFAAGLANTVENRKLIRAMIRINIKPDHRLMDRFAHKFLIGKKCGFDFPTLLKYVEQSDGAS
jgi:hypothetical protein